MLAIIQDYWWVILILVLVVLGLLYVARSRGGGSAAIEQIAASTGAALDKGKAAANVAVHGATDLASQAASKTSAAAAATVSGAGDAADRLVDVATATAAGAASAVQSVIGAKPNIAAAVGAPDDLLKIKGIGPKLNTLCQELGVTRYDQIAKWGPEDIAEVDKHLGTFRGRIVRDGWVEQAGLLAAGDVAAFEAKFGKLGSENK